MCRIFTGCTTLWPAWLAAWMLFTGYLVIPGMFTGLQRSARKLEEENSHVLSGV
jgi:hypothetical protein